MNEVTPAVRMSGWKALEALTRTGDSYRAVRQAQYWESFQNAYSAEQVAAGEELLLAWHDLFTAEAPVLAGRLIRVLDATDRVLELDQ